MRNKRETNIQIGDLLRKKRETLNLSTQEMAERTGYNRTSIERVEKGQVTLRRSSYRAYISGDQLSQTEAEDIFCSNGFVQRTRPTDEDIPVSVDDLEYLISVSRGLQSPLTVVQVRDLVLLRKPKSV